MIPKKRKEAPPGRRVRLPRALRHYHSSRSALSGAGNDGERFAHLQSITDTNNPSLTPTSCYGIEGKWQEHDGLLAENRRQSRIVPTEVSKNVFLAI